MTRLVVLGTSHWLQGARLESNIDDPSYRKLVIKLISDELIDYIFEEACGLGPTIASAVAKEKSIPYMDIQPSRHELGELDLPTDDGTVFIPIDDGVADGPHDLYWAEFPRRHVIKEQFWVEKIRRQDFACALLVCGYLHALSLSFRLLADFSVSCFCYLPYHKLCRH